MLSEYRNMIRVPLPENDSYVIKLGVALYSFAYTTTFLCEIISYHLDKNIDRGKLQGSDAGSILHTLRCVQSKREMDQITKDIQFTIDKYEEYKNIRNDLMHSYCVTGGDGQQTLHRNRKDGTDFEVTEDYIDSFIADFSEILDKLEKIRIFTRSAT